MNKSDITRNYPMLRGRFAKKGYDWWWHNFTGKNEETGEERTFFVEYFTCNPKLAGTNGGILPILGQSEDAKEKGLKPSYIMVKCGWWGPEAKQLNFFIPWRNVELGQDERGFHLSAPGFECNEKHLLGKVEISEDEAAVKPELMSDAGSMSWDLTVNKEVAFNVGYGAGSLFRWLTAFEMYWHAEGMKSTFEGTVTADGKKFTITPKKSWGYSDKNWGADFTSPWVWLSSNDLMSKTTHRHLTNSVFDIGGGRPKAFGIALNRKLLSDFWYEGKSYEFNFSKFWTGTKTVFDCREEKDKIYWYVKQSTKTAVMETEITCKKSDMLLVNYESPDGKKRHNRLWNGGTGKGTVKLWKKEKKGVLTLIDEIEAKHVGCEWGEYDEPSK